MATELMVSCKHASTHLVILATTMNFFLQMKILDMVVNRGLIESTCNISLCFPEGCHLCIC